LYPPSEPATERSEAGIHTWWRGLSARLRVPRRAGLPRRRSVPRGRSVLPKSLLDDLSIWRVREREGEPLLLKPSSRFLAATSWIWHMPNPTTCRHSHKCLWNLAGWSNLRPYFVYYASPFDWGACGSVGLVSADDPHALRSAEPRGVHE